MELPRNCDGFSSDETFVIAIIIASMKMAKKNQFIQIENIFIQIHINNNNPNVVMQIKLEKLHQSSNASVELHRFLSRQFWIVVNLC